MPLAKVHKIKGIRVIVSQCRGLLLKGRDDRMIANATKPILRI